MISIPLRQGTHPSLVILVSLVAIVLFGSQLSVVLLRIGDSSVQGQQRQSHRFENATATNRISTTGENDIDLLPLNVTGRTLCFIHVGKTGGASFRAQFADPQIKIVHHPKSLPQLRLWREFHVETKLRITRQWYNDCDFFVAWVRDPVERAVSGYNMLFDPALKHLLKSAGVQLQRSIVEQYGNLTSLAERLPIDPAGRTLFEQIEHVKFNTAWYFSSDVKGNALQAPVVATRMTMVNNNTFTESTTNKTIISRLSDPTFQSKLIFVGANECYKEDVIRFAKMFGIDDDFLDQHPMKYVHRSDGNFSHHETIHGLSTAALRGLRSYLSTDYEVLSNLHNRNLIHCQKLLQKMSSTYR